MTRFIGVLNYKGGTGKTTTVVNMAAGLAMHGHHVLCVDLDAQGGLATYLGVRYSFSLSHLLLGQAELPACITRARDNLDLIPSDRNLVAGERELWRMDDEWKARQRLAEKLDGLETYDYVLFDFSPSVGIIGESALRCIDELIVPVAMNYLALVGTRQVIETLKGIGHVPNHHLRLSLVVPTLYRGRLRKDREVMDVLERYFTDRLAKPIRRDVKLSEAPSYGKTIFEYAPESAGAKDYWSLVERIEKDV